ncbi:hypothetical protein TNCV_3249441 [Trichonephila clavipes]|nr:hypothetical protein TNCV_3249441 [Trichonephila clavipes]
MHNLAPTWRRRLDKNVGASRFNVLYGRQGCVLERTVESNQGGRFDGNESVADSFRSGAGVSESVHEFVARIKKLGTQIFQSGNSVQSTAARNANDQLLQSHFISGLRNEIRRFVLARDPNTLEESINAALIEEQNLKLNEIASNERSGLSAQAKESAVISALTDKLQELNLTVEKLQEANTINARKMTKGEFRRNMGVFKFFYCGIKVHRQIECRMTRRPTFARFPPFSKDN